MRRAIHLFGKAFRETGQALDRLGLTIAENEIYKETYARHRPLMNLFDKVVVLNLWSKKYLSYFHTLQRPVVAAGVFIAPNASVIGKVLLYNDVSVSLQASC